MERKYLFDSIEEFFESPMWEGERFYDAKPYRPWFGWIYIALYDHVLVEQYKNAIPNLPLKIGHSSNIDRRNKELFRNSDDQKASSIVFVWSVPLSIRFENDLKTLLSAYILPERVENQKGRSEIIWGIPLIPLISIVQLSILKTCLHMRYIRSDIDFILRPPDTIKEHNMVYPGKHKYMIPHELVINEIFEQFNIKEPDDAINVEDYIFIQDKRISAETSPTHTVPEFEGEILTHSEFLTGNVYKIGTYIYTKYTDNLLYLAKIIGYGKTKDQRYAIRWLVTQRGEPIRTGDPREPLELSAYKWEWSQDVVPIAIQNKALFNKFKDIDGVKVGDKVKVRKLRFK